MPKNIETLQIVNLNFGMHREDLKNLTSSEEKKKAKINYSDLLEKIRTQKKITNILKKTLLL